MFPGTSIPEWFDQQSSTGHSSSFWFRNNFPAKLLCLTIASVSTGIGVLKPKVCIRKPLLPTNHSFGDTQVFHSFFLIFFMFSILLFWFKLSKIHLTQLLFTLSSSCTFYSFIFIFHHFMHFLYITFQVLSFYIFQ